MLTFFTVFCAPSGLFWCLVLGVLGLLKSSGGLVLAGCVPGQERKAKSKMRNGSRAPDVRAPTQKKNY
jgi:hypothetical protein